MANRAPSLSQKLSNVQHMPVLITATAASKDSPEGFILKDIIKMSFESTPTRVFLQQYLVNQLCSTNNVFVKLRVLHCIMAVLEEGHVEFKQNLRKMPQPFSEASKLRPNQPRAGNLVAECGRIRDMASRILDILFEDTPELKPVRTHTAESGESSESSNRITGFGNSSYAPPKQQQTTTKLKKLFGTSSSGGGKTILYDPTYVTMDPVPHNQTARGSSISSGDRYQQEEALSGQDHVSGRAGGGWEDDVTDSTPKTTRTAQPQTTFTGMEDARNNGQDLEYAESASTEQEQRLVDEITAPGGIKAAIPRGILDSFVNRCRVLDCQSVVDFLRQKLESEENQVVLRSLLVIECLSRSDLPDILSHLDLVLEELNTLTQSSHSTIRTKANKILIQLNAQNTQAAQYKLSESKPTNRNESSTILNMGGVASEEVEKEEPVMSEEQAEFTATLFSGMSVSGESKSRPKAVKPVRKPVKQNKPVSSKAVPSSNVVDLLGLSNDSTPTEVTSSPAPPIHTQAPPTNEPLLLGTGEDSLLTFESDDEDFDPLKKRSNSIRSDLTGSTNSSQPPPTVSAVSMETKQESLNQQAQSSSTGLLGDLSGVDLSKTSSVSTLPTSQREQPLFAALQPLQPNSINMATSSTGQPLISTANVGGYPAQQGQLLNQGGILYAPVGPAFGGGAQPVYGGGVQQMPMMFMPMTGQTMPYSMPAMVGGEARPVQRAAPTISTETPTSDSGFSFLGKSNKGNAFDFVQDEMRASKSK